MTTEAVRGDVYRTLWIERPSPDILIVKFNRPEVSNALDTQMGRELRDLFMGLEIDALGLRCIVLTGSGDRAFCAGGDLKERDGMSEADWAAQHLVFEQAFQAIRQCPIPLIAAVNGAAYGGGCEFALCCDFIYAADTARFAQTETRLGIIPGGGGTQTLSRAVGAARAKEIIFSAQPFDAAQALHWGLVNRVVPAAELSNAALSMARSIAANAPLAVRQAKLAISRGIETDLQSGLALEIAAYNRCVPTDDRREGIAAARAKRPPRFTGR